MYDADPPFAPKSAISYAWSVGAVLELYRLMERFDPARAEGRSASTDARTAGTAKSRTAAATAAATKPAKRTKTSAGARSVRRTERKTVKK